MTLSALTGGHSSNKLPLVRTSVCAITDSHIHLKFLPLNVKQFADPDPQRSYFTIDLYLEWFPRLESNLTDKTNPYPSMAMHFSYSSSSGPEKYRVPDKG